MSRAGRWFLQSGIQEPSGGVARYYRTDLERNQPVSTEITGYAASALLYLQAATGESTYGVRALAAASFLARSAWDGQALPFEIEPGPEGRLAYFFDCGIVTRALLAAAAHDPGYHEVAAAMGRAMADDFAGGDGAWHPVLTLPAKRALPYEPPRWSRTPGCYQLKAALAWWDLFEATGETCFRTLYDRALDTALRTHGSFLPGHPDRTKVVDRLHAYLYFLEGLLPRADQPRCAAVLCSGIQGVEQILRETAAEFERSDVYAQLLRIRIYAHSAGAAALDEAAAGREAAMLTAFQAASDDPRIDGGFFFGRQAGAWLPYVNPVSTAFALEALELWRQYQNGGALAPARVLI